MAQGWGMCVNRKGQWTGNERLRSIRVLSAYIALFSAAGTSSSSVPTERKTPSNRAAMERDSQHQTRSPKYTATQTQTSDTNT